MSTLNVSNISDGTTSVGTSYVVNGSAKAWVNFNGTGTIAIRDSLSISSITDNGTGAYTITHNMGSINFSFSVGADYNSSPLSDGGRTRPVCNGHSSTQLVVETYGILDQTNFDSELMTATFWGELA